MPTTDAGRRNLAPTSAHPLAAGPALSHSEIGRLQRTAGNRAVQRLLAQAPSVQRESPSPGAATTEKTEVKAAGPVGGAGGALPPGSKVTVAPPTTEAAPHAGKVDDEKPREFHAEGSGVATVEKTRGDHAEGKGGAAGEVGVEFPKATVGTLGKEGDTQVKFLTNPEFKVVLTGDLDGKGELEGDVRTEVGIDIVRMTAGPWAYRMAAVGAEASAHEGVAAKVGAGVEKELPKSGGLGLKSEVAGGIGTKGPSGEASVKLMYGLKKGESTQVYFFGQAEGTVAKDGSHLKAEGTGSLGAGVKF